ncbi:MULTISPECIES: hypothetical protein [Bacillaceae]|uniref:Uncharacterized protein n=1 Tax=Metabacillus sediminis TaxID=3117746 RepID=A0ABZ2NHN5_9BACI|nr:hypothetical protein [Bacillus sp. SJS]KZZ85588.1 hypothetical protein AS29_004995 [Bacillus sp. SJS]
MFKNRFLKNLLIKGMPHKEQNVCELKLVKVIKRLKIEDYNFNWDRNSCFIEFYYKQEAYRLEHSIEKANEKGILLRNGMDCLNDLTDSLEDLCAIIDRGTYRFETWIAGMKQSPPKQEPPEYQEEFHIRYRSSGVPHYPELQRNETPFHPESPLKDFDENENVQLPLRK